MRVLASFCLSLFLLVLVSAQTHDTRIIFFRNHTLDTGITQSVDNLKAVRSLKEESPTQWLLHFKGPITTRAKREVELFLGTSLGSYFPQNTFLVVTTKSNIQRARKHPHILWTGPFLPEYKLSPLISKLPLPQFESNKLRVILEESFSPSVPILIESWSHHLSGSVVTQVGKFELVVTCSGDIHETAKWIANQVESHWIEPVSLFRAHNKWSTKIIQSGNNTLPISTIGKITGKGQIIALGDTGVVQQSCFFGDRISHDCTGCTDSNGHGTAVAATILGNPPSNSAVGGFSGHAPGASLFAIHLGFRADSNVESVVIERPPTMSGYFQKAYDSGARILVSGFGSSDPSYTADSASVDAFVSSNPNMLLIFPAGNSGTNPYACDSTSSCYTGIASPANSKNGLTVGSTQNAFDALMFRPSSSQVDALNAQKNQSVQLVGAEVVSTFSSRGPTFDGRVKPDLVAPGEVIYSASNGGCDDVAGFSGTSFAAGAVAGAAALVREYLASGFYPDGTANDKNKILDPTAAQIKAILINSGRETLGVDATGPLGSLSNFIYFTGIPDHHQGFGRIQLTSTLHVVGAGTSPFWLAPKDEAVSTGQTNRYCFTAKSAGKIKATLVWTDPAASPASASALVNNLDLVVVNRANGRQYKANGLMGFDNINNVEQVWFVNQQAGASFAAYVAGTNVPMGPQNFALVITGDITVDATCQGVSVCPSVCSQNGKCDNGICTCQAGFYGPDCSITLCPNDCNGNPSTADPKLRKGWCNLETATCQCNANYTGSDCGTVVAPQIIQQENSGIPTAALAGAAVGGVLMGLLLGGVIGWFIAVKYLENQRKKKREQLMRGQGEGM